MRVLTAALPIPLLVADCCWLLRSMPKGPAIEGLESLAASLPDPRTPWWRWLRVQLSSLSTFRFQPAEPLSS